MCEWFAAEKRLEMCEWLVATQAKMATGEEKTHHKRQPINLKRLNLMQYVQPIVRSLLSFLF